METLGQAHAKLIVLGEHFVVSGENPGSAAIALPLKALRTEVRITVNEDEPSCFNPSFGSSGLKISQPVQRIMKEAVRTAALAFGWDMERAPLSISSYTDFPIARGLGSSAAFSVALTRAFQSLPGVRSISETDHLLVAQRIENLYHGKSSGLDTSVILNDLPILYREGCVQETFQVQAVDFVVVDGGPRKECGSVLRKTLEFRRSRPEHWAELTSQVNHLVRRCMDALKQPRGSAEVTRTIAEAQKILSGIGLLTPQVSRVLDLGGRMGALAGKITGAGAGGAVLFVAQPGEGRELARRFDAAGAKVLAQVSPNTVRSQERLYA